MRETVAGVFGRIRVHPISYPLVLEPAIASFSPARVPYKAEQSTCRPRIMRLSTGFRFALDQRNRPAGAGRRARAGDHVGHAVEALQPGELAQCLVGGAAVGRGREPTGTN